MAHLQLKALGLIVEVVFDRAIPGTSEEPPVDAEIVEVLGVEIDDEGALLDWIQAHADPMDVAEAAEEDGE